MKDISAEEQLINLAYRRRYAEHSRVYQMAKVYLFSPSSGLFACPLAMTDGAAKTLEGLRSPELATSFERLSSASPDKFWTSGQWMTEKRGGSDVGGGTETVAVPAPEGSYRLYGYKWFSSASDSDVSLSLARSLDEQGQPIPGSRGLSMYFLETRRPDGKLNNMQVVRLKNKLGTRQLPTAELQLNGTVAHRVGDQGRGVASISAMLTLTRVHNAVNSVASMRRILQLARDYSRRRVAFGRRLCDWPLHVRTLAHMEVETRGCLALVLHIVSLLGRQDAGVAGDRDTLLLRLLTPICKLYTAKRAVSVTSEGLESFGGQGYIEDTGIPRLLRDAQVYPVWEGTTNVLSLDVLRALAKSRGEAWTALTSDVTERLLPAAAADDSLRPITEKVKSILHDVGNILKKQDSSLEVSARDLSFTIANTYICALLCHHAAAPDADDEDRTVALRWADREMAPLLTRRRPDQSRDELRLVMAGYEADD
ncbi:acyl-CoA dehydrogenase family member 11-like [Amphibalanus amphitrite]|uniref:acyl-CoA dehydrogenase family member 11-like n=1 Tax=Amphibalanus amphitrite TaxID=1232801 RepID=UPI001C8FD6C7|nr:acyl-CoA dehydrogenase family member 11-like [Amphibalanus amphitrite]